VPSVLSVVVVDFVFCHFGVLQNLVANCGVIAVGDVVAAQVYYVVVADADYHRVNNRHLNYIQTHSSIHTFSSMFFTFHNWVACK
jgi:hypothetical protein